MYKVNDALLIKIEKTQCLKTQKKLKYSVLGYKKVTNYTKSFEVIFTTVKLSVKTEAQ